MTWMVVGAKGMLGTDLVARIKEDGHDVRAVDIDDIDITKMDSVEQVVQGVDVVVNCAAFTAVDPAEENRRNSVPRQRNWPRELGPPVRENRRPPSPYLNRLRVPWRRRNPMDRRSPHGSSLRLRPHQSSRRMGSTHLH